MWLLWIWSTLPGQGGPLTWVCHHRRHHKHVELSLAGFWVSLYALAHAELPKAYVQLTAPVAVSFFLQRYVYRAAEELFAHPPTPEELEEKRKKWWFEQTHLTLDVNESLFKGCSTKMARELLYFERTFRHLFCRFLLPLLDGLCVLPFGDAKSRLQWLLFEHRTLCFLYSFTSIANY